MTETAADDKELVLAAIRECITIIKPGEVLAVRLHPGTDEQTLDLINQRCGDFGRRYGIGLLFVGAEEFAVFQAREQVAAGG